MPDPSDYRNPAFASWRPQGADLDRYLQFLANAPTQMPQVAKHERSETIQNPSGQWININGLTGEQLAPRVPGEQNSYGTINAAEEAARQRSKSFDPEGAL